MCLGPGHDWVPESVRLTQESIREVGELAAALEIESEHPLADAIIKFAAETLGHSMQAQGAWLMHALYLYLQTLLRQQSKSATNNHARTSRPESQLPGVGFVAMEGGRVYPCVAACAGSPNKATARMNRAAADGSIAARRVDWVRPAKDTTIVAGESMMPLAQRLSSSYW